MKLVNYWDKYTEMRGQQNVKIKNILKNIMLIICYRMLINIAYTNGNIVSRSVC